MGGEIILLTCGKWASSFFPYALSLSVDIIGLTVKNDHSKDPTKALSFTVLK